jgi:hypothetical protein
LVIDPVKIRNAYFRGFFFPDFLSTVPFDKIMEAIMIGDKDDSAGSAETTTTVR